GAVNGLMTLLLVGSDAHLPDGRGDAGPEPRARLDPVPVVAEPADRGLESLRERGLRIVSEQSARLVDARAQTRLGVPFPPRDELDPALVARRLVHHLREVEDARLRARREVELLSDGRFEAPSPEQ